MTHNFADSLAFSDSYADAPWWWEVYEQAFPTLQNTISVRKDGWAQRGGIDRQLILADGTVLKVDEKVRAKAYPDFCLEFWSDFARRIPGWANKDLTCDYIAYAFVPTATCYLLPFQLLRRACHEHEREWLWLANEKTHGFRRVEADNGRYVTVSLAVPIAVVLDAVRDAMIVRWQPSNDGKGANV